MGEGSTCGLQDKSLTVAATNLAAWIGADADLVVQSYRITCMTKFAHGVVDDTGSVSLMVTGKGLSSVWMTLTLGDKTATWSVATLTSANMVSLGPDDFVTGGVGAAGSSGSN